MVTLGVLTMRYRCLMKRLRAQSGWLFLLLCFVSMELRAQESVPETTPTAVAAPKVATLVSADLSSAEASTRAVDSDPVSPSPVNPSTTTNQQIEDLKKSALELNRDLMILEEDLLFPANTQIAVFVSLDVGAYFSLDAVKLSIDGELVASHLYTAKQNTALARGGIQRLYLGNVKSGQHEITAVFHGIGPEKREYKRGATYKLTKNQSPSFLEIQIRDNTGNMQPSFEFKEWRL
jgi:hypothetical protein